MKTLHAHFRSVRCSDKADLIAGIVNHFALRSKAIRNGLYPFPQGLIFGINHTLHFSLFTRSTISSGAISMHR